jgi:hypothetical protein
MIVVCGKCGGEIESCGHGDARFIDKFVPLDRPVFICKECHQVSLYVFMYGRHCMYSRIFIFDVWVLVVG